MEVVRERKGIEKRFYELTLKLVEDNGYLLYDLDYLPSNHELRVFIYNPETKSALIEDCVKVDKAFDEYLEEEWVPETLTLQVSSPGLFRNLKCLEHFNMSKGEMVSVVLSRLVEGIKDRKIIGKVCGVTDNGVDLEIEGKEYVVPLENIKKANLETEIEKL